MTPRTILLTALTTLACVAGTLAPTAARTATAQTSPRAAMLEAAAWDALEARQFEQAATAFREAVAGDPDNPRLHLGAALAAFATRRDADAKAAAERALALEPQSAMARELLGRVLYRTGDLDTAIRTFESLAADGAADADITDTLDRWRREAELRSRMQVAVGTGVTVAFDGPEDAALAEQAVAALEQAATRIWEVLSYYPVRPVSVVLYTNEQFADITRSPAWAGGSFDGLIRVPMRGALANPAELQRVLAHEYVHALVHELAGGGVPAWLNEGLAVALERETAPPAPQATPAGELTLRALERSFGRLPRPQAEQAYAFSASAVRRLLDEAGGAAIVNLLADLGAGEAFDRAFEHRVGRSFASFEATLR
jgi:tetratricopeptide (TPR) repeat protein